MALIKSMPALIKAAGAADGLGVNEFEAIVSVFNNVDSYGDVVLPGAYADTLSEWKASGDPLPVIWSHDWSDPSSHIGVVLDAQEWLPGDSRLPAKLADLGGLWVKGQVDTPEENAKAGQIMRLLKGRRVKQFSFAYDIVEGGWIKHDGREAYGLAKLAVHEIGPTLLGVNQETDLLAAKSALARMAEQARKSGARHSTKDAAILQEIHDKFVELGIPCSTSDDGKASQGSTDQGAYRRKSDGADESKLSPASVALSAELALICAGIC